MELLQGSPRGYWVTELNRRPKWIDRPVNLSDCQQPAQKLAKSLPELLFSRSYRVFDKISKQFVIIRVSHRQRHDRNYINELGILFIRTQAHLALSESASNGTLPHRNPPIEIEMSGKRGSPLGASFRLAPLKLDMERPKYCDRAT